MFCQLEFQRKKWQTIIKCYTAENETETAVRFSEMGYLENGKITNVPLYLAFAAKRLM